MTHLEPLRLAVRLYAPLLIRAHVLTRRIARVVVSRIVFRKRNLIDMNVKIFSNKLRTAMIKCTKLEKEIEK